MSWRERLTGLAPLRRGQVECPSRARLPEDTPASRNSAVEIVRAAIDAVDKSLPETASLKERIAAIDAAYPFGKRVRNNKYRVWCRERRYYLRRFGFVCSTQQRCGPRYNERKGQRP